MGKSNVSTRQERGPGGTRNLFGNWAVEMSTKLGVARVWPAGRAPSASAEIKAGFSRNKDGRAKGRFIGVGPRRPKRGGTSPRETPIQYECQRRGTGAE